MTDDLQPLADALDRVSPETRALIDFLVDRPLAKRRTRSTDEKERWATRDLRAAVRYELYSNAPGSVVTLPEIDELLSHQGVSDRVWELLTSPELRGQIPLR